MSVALCDIVFFPGVATGSKENTGIGVSIGFILTSIGFDALFIGRRK